MDRSLSEARELIESLRPRFGGEIRLDHFDRLLYSTDASIYQIEPLAVLIPRAHEDVAAAVEAAARHRVPILPRGAGTSLAGQTVGAAIVLDYSKYLNRILHVDPDARAARVEPGVVLDQLNAHVRTSGLQFGPDVATSNRATIGGMIGNNSCGARSVLYGKMVDHVRELRALIPGGPELRFGGLSSDEWRRKTLLQSPEGVIFRTVDRLLRENASEIRARYPKVLRHVGGYNLDRMLADESRNLSRLIVGSEGTLAAFTEAVVNLVPAPARKAIDVIHFPGMIAALESVPAILETGPAAIELVDRTLLDMTRAQPGFARQMDFVNGTPAAILIVEYYGDSDEEVTARIERLEGCLRRSASGIAFVRALEPAQQTNVWAVRKAGLGLLSSTRGAKKPVAFVEDTAVPPQHLGDYVRRFTEVLERHETRAGFYGHASVGCLHIRPFMNLKDPNEVRRMVAIAAEVKDLVREFGGAMSGEHGDGLVRSHWNRELFGDRLYSAFRELKAAFDPVGIMNPGKIIASQGMTENLRYRPDPPVSQPETWLDFSQEGGLRGAVEQCSGLGACRKIRSGTMCPSYMATLEEEHSTRGRAVALRASLTGQIPFEDFSSPRMRQALDLCLECKACKTECPAGVDMAKVKYEFLAHYNRRHGTPLRSKIFGHIALLSRLGSATAPVSNVVLNSRLIRRTILRLLGIHPDRSLPAFARESFVAWLRKNPRRPKPEAPTAVLFNDTFTNYNEPAIGRAALRLLEDAGMQVIVPAVVCCGRPMISKGMLDEARENARKNIAILAPLVRNGAVVIGCEPSCLLTLREEYPELVRTEEARVVAASAKLLDEFLSGEVDAGRWRPRLRQQAQSILLHSHCHQKSLVGTGSTISLLSLPPGNRVREIDSGCCGMAGAFGFELEHYDMSLRIGGERLFPDVMAAPPGAVIVAPGISCRQQIRHATGRLVRHPAEVAAEALEY